MTSDDGVDKDLRTRSQVSWENPQNALKITENALDEAPPTTYVSAVEAGKESMQI